MRKLVLLGVILLLSLACVAADDTPKAEIFGGYSLMRVDFGSGTDKQTFNGFDTAVTGNFNKYLGVTADISGQFKSLNAAGSTGSIHLYNFLFGPQIGYRAGKLRPFAHALFGVSRISGSLTGAGSDSDKAFAMAFGGGLDFKVANHFSVRPAQLDWVRTQFSGTSQNHLRYAVGGVFTF